jgi:glycosyltransferase involved in cell wall biosynthesis
VSGIWLDVTDLVEFLTRRESVSGVQRVIMGAAPLLISSQHSVHPVFLDRTRGVFVALTKSESDEIFGEDAGTRADTAEWILARGQTAQSVDWKPDDVALFLGAVWIHDGLMMAARGLHLQGVRLIFLIYDLTPVLGANHTPVVRNLFQRYLALVLQTAVRAPAISKSSRRDLEEYADLRSMTAPPGSATGLPSGLHRGAFPESSPPWPRPYVLFVGTVEGRKQHLLALTAWQQLITDRGESNVPDLVCVGRLGWNAEEFLMNYVATDGLDGKVAVLSSSVPDEELARFYAHAEFTVYPSRYEGWGLPISESLAFGKVVISARNSSLAEAGGELASYFETDDLENLLEVIGRDGLNGERRSMLEQRIESEYQSTTWQHVADILEQEITMALTEPMKTPGYPDVLLGHEYMLAGNSNGQPDSAHGDQVMEYLLTTNRTPLLQQQRGADDFLVTDAALIGDFGVPQTWGLELRPGRYAEFRCARPSDGDLLVLFATRAMPGIVRVEAVGPGGPMSQEVALGAVLSLRLGSGRSGEPAQVTFGVRDASDSIEGFLGLCSFVVLEASDERNQILAYQSAANALRQELDFMTNTRSWRMTAPLRRFGGRRPRGV